MRAARVLQNIGWLDGRLRDPGWRFAGQRLGNPPQLTSHHTQAEQDQAPDNSSRAGTDERISEAELIDRHTKADHHEASEKSECADAIQQSRHTFLIPSSTSRFLPQATA